MHEFSHPRLLCVVVAVTRVSELGPIDCDVHIAPPPLSALFEYMDEYWRDHFTVRGSHRLKLQISSAPPNTPISARPDWRIGDAFPGSDLGTLQKMLDRFGTRFAICNCIHWGQALHSEDMSAAVCRGINGWIADNWLNNDTRLRASILIPSESPEQAVVEIERCANDGRFVQVLMLASGEMPLGRRQYWPIYEAAQALGLAVGIHGGSSYRFPPSPSGWHSYFIEDYVVQSLTFQSQLLSLLTEGVFSKCPDLKVVFMESGFTWLPAFLWRADKTWRGVRREVPWLASSPSELVKKHVRFTLQPVNGPPDPSVLEEVLEQIEADKVLLFSTDYPHWHFDGDEAVPSGFSGDLLRRMLVDNALETFPRLSMPANLPQEKC